MKKLVLILSTLLFLIGTTDVQAQWGKKLLKKAGESAKRATERNVEKKIEKTVDKAFDGAEDAVTGKGNEEKKKAKTSTNTQGNTGAADDGGDVAQEQPQQTKQSAEMTYAKSDFVAGDEIIFDDDLVGEQMGEFPSQWDLVSGSAEIATIDKFKCIYFEDGKGHIAPLMKNMNNYLPEIFTLEFDFFVNGTEGFTQGYTINFQDEAKKDRILEIDFGSQWHNDLETKWRYKTPGGEWRSGDAKSSCLKTDAWYHFSLSFNKRALKIYINGVRVANVPSMVAPSNFSLMGRTWGTGDKFKEAVANFRIAKGAVPLYDRMMTDGKFITYGITFDVGKSTIKPESMGEINRIVTLMKENPDLKFSVEGHTDSTGNEASNQTLSEARSKAIVDKLVELGIPADRLTSAGKGQSSPIADNSTDEGRAKNRRVEFVKL